MAILAYVFAVIAGVSNPLQSGSNSALLKGLGAPIVAAFVVYAIGSLCPLACIPFLGFPARSAFGKIGGLPWWAFVGGVCNVVFLQKNQFAQEIDHMAECVRTGRRPRTPGEEGLQDHLLMESIYRAAREGAPVRLAPVDGLDTTRGPEVGAG